MTMGFLNELIDASIRGTLMGITIFFWGVALVSVWKWLLGIAKNFLRCLFPNFFKKKDADTETNVETDKE